MKMSEELKKAFGIADTMEAGTESVADSLETDRRSREKIVSDIDGNFFVEAGAGSGKTTMLVNRLVAMVEQGREIEQICAITFTKAAAGEFYDRFQKLLIQRSMETQTETQSKHPGSLPPATEESRRRCRYALQNIDLCFMGTIDSFCNMVLSEHPTEAGVVSNAAVMSEQELRQFYRQEYVHITKGVYGQTLRRQALLFSHVQKNPAEAFADLLKLLMDNRNVEFQLPDDAEAAFFANGQTSLEDYFGKDKKALLKTLEHTVTKLERKDQWIVRRAISIAKGNWDDCFRNVLDQLHYLDHVSGKDDALDVRGQDGFAGLMSKMEKFQYSVSLRFLQNCIAPLEKIRLERGRMTYFDYLYLLREMLRKDAAGDGALIRHIGARHKYFLIDEFQDTNPMQAEIFFYLGSDAPVENWRKCKPRCGALFIVGDPKQSIYRFRGADVDAFLQVRRIFEEGSGEVLELTRNFRSTPLLKRYFNSVFIPVFRAKEGETNSCPYWPIPIEEQETTIKENAINQIGDTEDAPKEFGGIYSYESISYKAKYMADCPKYIDKIKIVALIKKLVGNVEYQIRPKDGKELRPLLYNDIMVITHNKRELGPIMQEMREEGIPCRVEGKVDFEHNEALRGLWKLYQAVALGGSRHLYEALTGEILHLQEADLLGYCRVGGELKLQKQQPVQHATSEYLKVASELEHLRLVSEKARYMSPAGLLEYLMEEYRIYMFVDTDNMEVVYYTLERMRAAQRNGEIVSISDGSEFLKKRVLKKRAVGEDEEERCLRLREDENCVHLANLHKVKGLEAPVVILAYWFNIASPADIPGIRIERAEDGVKGYLFSADSPEKFGAFQNKKYLQTDAFHEEFLRECDAVQAEFLRLVYVAATRARNALIISRSGYYDLRKKKFEPRPKWNVLLDMMYCNDERFNHFREPEKAPEPVAADRKPASELYEEAVKKSVLQDRAAEKPSFSVHTPSTEKEEKCTSRFEEDYEEALPVEAPEEKALVHRYPGVFGTMMHRMMELLVLSRGKIADRERMLKGIFEEYATPEIQSYEQDFLEALHRALAQLENGGYPQGNGVPTDILHTLWEADEVYCEVPFSYRKEYRMEQSGTDEVWYGIMDVVYRKGTEWHIVDYKTNVEGENLDEEYHAQMQAYSRAFSETTGNEAEAHTYHIKV